MDDKVRTQLRRILTAPSWQGSERRNRMLSYIVEETLKGATGALKGLSIAAEVFGRPGDSSEADGIVRVEARRLRRDLDSYYVDEGRNDPVRIRIPKGGYTPQFEYQATKSDAEAASADLLLGPTVLVLPFDSIKRDAFSISLASGLTHELITGLMHFPSFRVYSAADSFRAGPATGLADVGERFNAAFVVQGNVRSSASEVAVDVRLTDAADSRVLWSATLRRQKVAHSLIKLTSEIAVEIATSLSSWNGPIIARLRERMAAIGHPDLSSYHCVLDYYTYRLFGSSASHPSMLARLQGAVLRDPGYVDAWIALSYVHLDGYRLGYAPETDKQQALIQARSAIDSAFAIERDQPPLLLARSAIQYYSGEYEASIEGARRAVALNPYDVMSLAGLAWRLVLRGHFEEGLEVSDRVIRRSARVYWSDFVAVALVRLMEGDYAAMLEASEKGAESGQGLGYALLAIAHGYLGNTEAASDALKQTELVWPALTKDPGAVCNIHHMHEDLAAAFVSGLDHARSVAQGGT